VVAPWFISFFFLLAYCYANFLHSFIEADFETPGSSQDSPEIYDRSAIATPPEEPSYSGAEIDTSPDSLHGDARGDMSMPDHTAPTGSNRRRPRPQVAAPQRSVGTHPSQPPSMTHGYPTYSSENVHNRHPTGFQGSSLPYPSPSAPYSQQPAYVGQYTMSSQPSPMPMAHSAPPYAFTPYHHQDNSMISHNTHANYRPMLQPPHAPVFPYQRHSPEGGSASHASFSGTRSSPMYQPHQVNNSSSPASPHLSSNGSQGGALTPPSYVGSGQFHSLRYPSPMSTNPYQYPTHSFSPSLFQSQYPPPFGQHYTPTGETEPQGAWYYLPHAPVPSPQQYDSGSSYQGGHYSAVTYPGLGHTEVDGGYGAGGQSSSSANPSSPAYLMSPGARAFSQYSEDQASPVDSPHASGAGPPLGPSPVAVGSASSGSGRHVDKPVVRRSYHPNPPAHRSEWVMWAGNVPSDATHDELWRFFNQPSETQDSNEPNDSGVLSIFLISRSSCAFINYKSEAFLHGAITRFNGVPLRPNDPRCARLVCRVRRKDDDLKAGVGGQRGMGMHTKWIKEQKGKQRDTISNTSEASDDPSISPTSISERMAAAVSVVSISSDEHGDERVKRGIHAKHSSSSGSFASTNSSFLTRHFPKRYFILKSLTQYDLDLSVQRGVWATQKHNEEILDQAFRTSKEVYLIFGVNKSGEFYGYARMTGPVRRGEHRVSWASRSSQSPLTRELKPGEPFFSPSDLRLVDSSPLPVESGPRTAGRHSAPALMGERYHLPTLITPKTKHSLDQRITAPGKAGPDQGHFELDASAPRRAMKHPSAAVDGQEKARSGPALQSVKEVEEKEVAGADHVVDGAASSSGDETWGECFAVQWISTERLPFQRTRHLRNPWNHDREVKVSRDGTELEPTVGEQLLEEWNRLAEPQAQAPSKVDGKRATGPKNPGPSEGFGTASKGIDGDARSSRS